MAKTRPHAREVSAPSNDDEYEFYYFEDLLRKGIVTSRPDLYRKIKHEDFPRPEKPPGAPMQVRAPYRKVKVHSWCDHRAASHERDEQFATGSEKDLRNTEGPPKRRGRPRKVPAIAKQD